MSYEKGYKIGDIIIIDNELKNMLWYYPGLFEIIGINNDNIMGDIISIEDKKITTNISTSHICLDKNTLRLKKLERIIESE